MLLVDVKIHLSVPLLKVEVKADNHVRFQETVEESGTMWKEHAQLVQYRHPISLSQYTILHKHQRHYHSRREEEPSLQVRLYLLFGLFPRVTYVADDHLERQDDSPEVA